MGAPRGVNGTSRNFPRPGTLGRDPGSPMARPAVSQGTPPTNERVQIVATGATSGTFQVRVVARSGNIDVTSAAINWNDTLAQAVAKVDAALGGLGRVTGVSGGPLPAAILLDFGGDLGGTDITATITGSTLVGGTAAATTTQTATPGVIPVVESRNGGFLNSRSSAMARPRGFGR
jgi:hypothetical protein